MIWDAAKTLDDDEVEEEQVVNVNVVMVVLLQVALDH